MNNEKENTIKFLEELLVEIKKEEFQYEKLEGVFLLITSERNIISHSIKNPERIFGLLKGYMDNVEMSIFNYVKNYITFGIEENSDEE